MIKNSSPSQAPRGWAVVAATSGFSFVALAAWASHGLPRLVPPEQLPATLEAARSAALMHGVHSLALLVLALWLRLGGSRWLHVAGACFVLGLLGFVGGIYGVRVFALQGTGFTRVVPWGGSLLMLGWLCLGVAAWRQGPA